jgi:hypothetical protein
LKNGLTPRIFLALVRNNHLVIAIYSFPVRNPAGVNIPNLIPRYTVHSIPAVHSRNKGVLRYGSQVEANPLCPGRFNFGQRRLIAENKVRFPVNQPLIRFRRLIALNDAGEITFSIRRPFKNTSEGFKIMKKD